MKRRLHRAIQSASELRALLVLIVLLSLRAWRTLQFKYQSLPNILQVVETIRARVLSSPFFDRRRIHWVGQLLPSPLGRRVGDEG